MSDDSEECWQCRLISGGGLMGAAAYVIHQGKKFKGLQRQGITLIGYGIGLIGTLRLLGLPPFKAHKTNDKNVTDKKEEDEYIIGKFTTKYN